MVDLTEQNDELKQTMESLKEEKKNLKEQNENVKEKMHQNLHKKTMKENMEYNSRFIWTHQAR